MVRINTYFPVKQPIRWPHKTMTQVPLELADAGGRQSLDVTSKRRSMTSSRERLLIPAMILSSLYNYSDISVKR